MDNLFKFSLPSEFPKNSVTLQVLHKEEHKDEKGHEILQGILQSPRQVLVGDRTTLSTYLILDMILLDDLSGWPLFQMLCPLGVWKLLP